MDITEDRKQGTSVEEEETRRLGREWREREIDKIKGHLSGNMET